jgi:hypothetical protein
MLRTKYTVKYVGRHVFENENGRYDHAETKPQNMGKSLETVIYEA